jgi:DNA gyrase subunit A
MLIENPQIGDEELAGLIPGPDFPTGGVISSPSSIRQIYLTGQGELRLRGNAKIVTDGSRTAVVVTETPFLVWKGRIAEEAAEGILDGVLGNIVSVSDESDQHSTRLVFQLRAGAAPEQALAQLFAHTSLETTLRVEMLASVDGAPQRVSLPTLLRTYARQLTNSLTKPGDHEPTPERKIAELKLLRGAHDDARRTRLATTRD